MAASETIRTARTLGVTRKLSDDLKYQLAELRRHPGFPALLDVMEEACIEQETALLNRDVSEPAAILAEHGKAQVAWQIFTHLQERLEDASQFEWEERQRNRPRPRLSEQEQIDSELLDPINHLTLETT